MVGPMNQTGSVDAATGSDVARAIVAATIHGPMVVLCHDTVVGRFLGLYGEFAQAQARLLTAMVGPGDVVVDVGANVGASVLPFARGVGPSGRVLAFEPQPVIAACLERTLALNGLAQVEVRRCAVGAAAGVIDLALIDAGAPENYGAAPLRREGPGATVRTPIVALDGLGFDRCDLLKIDAEGMDPDVIAGARTLLGTFRPVVYFEAHRGPGTLAALADLAASGYRSWWHHSTYLDDPPFRGVCPPPMRGRGDLNVLGLPVGRDAPVGLRPTGTLDVAAAMLRARAAGAR